MNYNKISIVVSFLNITLPLEFICTNNGEVVSVKTGLEEFSKKAPMFFLGSRYEEFQNKLDYLIYLYKFAITLAYYDFYVLSVELACKYEGEITPDYQPEEIQHWINELLIKKEDYNIEYLNSGLVLFNIIQAVQNDITGWQHMEDVVLWDYTSPISELWYVKMLEYVENQKVRVKVLCEISRYPDKRILLLVLSEIFKLNSRAYVPELLKSLKAWKRKDVSECLTENSYIFEENSECYNWINYDITYWNKEYRLDKDNFKVTVKRIDRERITVGNHESIIFINRLISIMPNRLLKYRRTLSGEVEARLIGNDTLELVAYDEFIPDIIRLIKETKDKDLLSSCQNLLRVIGLCSLKLEKIISGIISSYKVATESGIISCGELLSIFYLISQNKKIIKEYIEDIIRDYLNSEEQFDRHSRLCSAIAETYDKELIIKMLSRFKNLPNKRYPLLITGMFRNKFIIDEKYNWKNYCNHGAGRY